VRAAAAWLTDVFRRAASVRTALLSDAIAGVLFDIRTGSTVQHGMTVLRRQSVNS